MRKRLAGFLVVAVAAISMASAQEHKAAPRPRARELGIQPGIYQPGPNNAITDVLGKERS